MVTRIVLHISKFFANLMVGSVRILENVKGSVYEIPFSKVCGCCDPET